MKSNEIQQELFEDISAKQKPRIFKKPDLKISELSLTLHNERLVFLSVGIILICVLSFSLGMERGKSLAGKTPLAHMSANRQGGEPALSEAEGLTPVEPATAPVKKEAEELKQVSQPQQKSKKLLEEEFYTVQVAAYKTKKMAEEEVKNLQKRGVTAFLASKKDFNFVYAGSFSDRDKARDMENKLKKNYKDCFIVKRRAKNVNTSQLKPDR